VPRHAPRSSVWRVTAPRSLDGPDEHGPSGGPPTRSRGRLREDGGDSREREHVQGHERPGGLADDWADDLSAASDARDLPEAPGSALVRSVAAAYTAAHGHPAEHDTLVDRETGRRRWALGLRAALAAAVALLVVGGVVVVRDLRTMSVEPVAVSEGDGAAAEVGGAQAQTTGDDQDGGENQGDAVQTTSGEMGDGSSAPEDDVSSGAGASGEKVLVHVVGQVNAPGVVEIPAGSRVVDAIAAAGGATAEADTAAVNLARQAVDGEQVYVPAPGEVVPVPGAGPAPAGGPGGGDTSGTPGAASVNLNSAGSEELQTLPGVGPALAQRILDWRESNGTFGSIDQLQDVSGIGPVVFEGLRALVTV
jgi:competence protein ComEA